MAPRSLLELIWLCLHPHKNRWAGQRILGPCQASASGAPQVSPARAPRPVSRTPRRCHPLLGAAPHRLQSCPRGGGPCLDCLLLAPLPSRADAILASATCYSCLASQRLLLRRLPHGYSHAGLLSCHDLETPALGPMVDRNTLRNSSGQLLDHRRDLSICLKIQRESSCAFRLHNLEFSGHPH